MISEFKLTRMSSLSIKEPEMIAKYASLGYFHYKYICTLDTMNSCENLVKDNGVLRGYPAMMEGSYLSVSIADFSRKRKHTYLYWYPQHRMWLSVGDLVDLIESILPALQTDSSNLFVKFDAYALVH